MGNDAVVGLVLAAGAGRRMGGPKGLLRVAPTGASFVETAIAHLHEAGVGEVHVVVGASAAHVAALAAQAGGVVVEAAGWGEGMGASLRAGLDALEPTAARAALVMLVDLPDVGTGVHERVLEAAGDTDGDLSSVLVRAAYDGIPGHPVLLGREHWAAIREGAVGDRGARDHLAGPRTRLVECGDLATGRDVDRPTDLPTS
ncbi:nucleotidyltransferase family protein [Knoellia sp. CPCC 206435]|uniref:nucleotidyltransferase family protein n=1 Tax=Knoellia terrae TaxID=3404797 RepID=UPI003B43C0FF